MFGGGFFMCWVWMLGGCAMLVRYAQKKNRQVFDFGWPMIIVGLITWCTGISILWQLMVYASLLWLSLLGPTGKGIRIGGFTIKPLKIKDQDNFFWKQGKEMPWYEKLAIFLTRPRGNSMIRLSRVWTTTTDDQPHRQSDESPSDKH